MNLNKSQLTNIMNAFFYLITAEPFILSLVPTTTESIKGDGNI